MAAPYTVVGESFRADTPQLWSPTNVRGDSIMNSAYDLHPDGKRVATAAAQEQGSGNQDKVVFVFNFFDYLRKIAPGTNKASGRVELVLPESRSGEEFCRPRLVDAIRNGRARRN